MGPTLDLSTKLFYSSRIFGWLTGLERAAKITGRRGFLLPKLLLGSSPTSL